MKKSIILFSIIFVIVGAVIGVRTYFNSDKYEFKESGTIFYTDNSDYYVTSEKYDLQVAISNDLEEGMRETWELEEFTLTVSYYKYEEGKLFINFEIINYGDFEEGIIAYLYPFETNESEYDVVIQNDDQVYHGRTYSEGPWNNNIYNFGVYFKDVDTEFLQSNDIDLKIEDMIINYYKRK